MKRSSTGLWVTSKLLGIERKLAGLERREAELGGLKMVYFESKNPRSKPALFLIHGYTADKSIWARCAKYFAKDYHIIIPDMAGHGETPYDPKVNYSVPVQAKWIYKLAAYLNIEKLHIAGNSMGGFIAAYFAKTYPEQTLSAVLLDPAGIESPTPSDIQAIIKQGNNLFLPKTQQEFRQFIGMTMKRPPYIPTFSLRAMGSVHISRRDRYAHIFDDFFGQDSMENQLKYIKAPVLNLWGEKDRILHVSAAPIWQNGIKDCKTIIWGDIGHVPMFEMPKRTANAMKLFLAENTKKTNH